MANTVLDALKGVNAYPVPLRTHIDVAGRRGLTLTEEATSGILHGRAYNLAVADILLWLSVAPNIAQGGQNYSFTDEQRVQFRNRAKKLYNKYGDEAGKSVNAVYGYKGDRL